MAKIRGEESRFGGKVTLKNHIISCKSLIPRLWIFDVCDDRVTCVTGVACWRKWKEVESEMRGWVGDGGGGRQDIREEGQKRKNIHGEKISASSFSREEGRQLFTDWWYSRVVANGEGDAISSECNY